MIIEHWRNDDNCTKAVSCKFNVTDVTTSFSNSIPASRSHRDGLNAHFMSLEDKFIRELYELKKWNRFIP